MQMLTYVALALGIVSGTLGAVVTTNVERAVAKDVKVIHVNGIDIQTGSLPVPKDRLDALANATVRARSPVPDTSSLTKRTVNNCCFYGCTRTCVDGLSSSPDPPTSADCAALKSAVEALAASELTTTFPCNLPNQASCPNFAVAPGWEQAYWYNTCLVGFINLNPSGSADESYCDYLMAGIITSSYNDCVTNQGKTGGYCLQYLSPGYVYALELRHV
ncbi:hypothetical protein ONZ45_g387 [Pleurotus djamor]|nr:hypothetical protein ONZ45_g387 [Pleurotus djamor]